MPGEIRQLFEYNRWANQRILDAAAPLSPEELTRDLGSSFPSVLATLAHVASADWAWLQRWNGTSPTGLPQWDVSTLDAIRARWDEVERDRHAFLAGLRDEDLVRVIAYRNLAGEAFQAPLWQLLRHVANHATYHRGQVVTLLRQLGHAAPPTDLGLFFRLTTD